jgi:protein tyrosine phosphatase (PTP) superfamily phosphohydrolase (DUF442 family)
MSFLFLSLPVHAELAPVQAAPSFAGAEAVTPNLYRGPAPSDATLSHLQKIGVRTVVDLRLGDGNEHERASVEKLGMHYINIPLGFGGPSAQAVQQFLKIATDSNNGPIFVHCRQGRDRTGTMVGVYRMVVQHWTFDKTYTEMRDHKFKPFLVGMKDTVEQCQKRFGIVNNEVLTYTPDHPASVPAESTVPSRI